MTNIVVLIKQVPDTWSERKLKDGDWTLDREAADAVLDEINERAVEEALLIREKEAADGTGGSVTVVIAEYLGLPQLTHLRKLSLDGGKITGERETDDGVFTVEAS